MLPLVNGYQHAQQGTYDVEQPVTAVKIVAGVNRSDSPWQYREVYAPVEKYGVVKRRLQGRVSFCH